MIQLERPLLIKMLVLALRPIASFCLRHSLRLQDLAECAKAAFVEAAAKDLEQNQSKKNVSRISVMTGVHRRDVMRIQDQGVEGDQTRGLIARVMGQWRTDKRFVTKSGHPRVLTFGADNSEFTALVHSISQDLNPGTVFFELNRVGAVVPGRGGIKLIHESYVPKGDPLAGFSILANDCDSLFHTVEENVITPEDTPQFHARTEYDNVRPDAAPEIKRWFLKEGHEFHARVREFISKFDQDVNPTAKFKGKGMKVVFGGFSNVQKMRKKT